MRLYLKSQSSEIFKLYNKYSKLILSNWFSITMIKIVQQKQEKQNTFNENSKNKVSDAEKITDVNWLKYKLSFWRCNKSFLQTVSCTEFCKLYIFFWCQYKFQQKLSYPPKFQNTFFQIWQQSLCSTNLKLVWLGTSSQWEFNKKNVCNLMCMHHQNFSSKLVSWKKNWF